jgi:hypothetical protein
MKTDGLDVFLKTTDVLCLSVFIGFHILFLLIFNNLYWVTKGLISVPWLLLLFITPITHPMANP